MVLMVLAVVGITMVITMVITIYGRVSHMVYNYIW